MNVLILTNMYPSGSPGSTKGIFVKQQVDSIVHKSTVGVDVFNIDLYGRGWRKYVASAFYLRKVLKKDYDLLHIHYGLSFLTYLLYRLLLGRKLPFIVTFHGSDVLGPSYIVRFVSYLAAYFSDYSIAVSDEILSKLNRLSHKACVIPCAVNDAFFNVKYAPDASKPVAVFPSDPDRPEKNYSYFSEVVNLYRQNVGELNVVCLKNLSKEQVVELLSHSSVLMLTSDREGSPQVVKEAIAIGLPVVARRVGDLEVISRYTDGLFLVDDKNEMVARVAHVINVKPVVRNRDEFYSQYGAASISAKIVDLYLQCVK